MLKRLRKENGQGLVEYTLIVLLVALVFWVAIKESGVGDSLAQVWKDIDACLESPLKCKGAN